MGETMDLEAYRSHFEAVPGYLDFARYGPPSLDVVHNARTAMSRVTSGENDVEELREYERSALASVARLTGRDGPDQAVFASSTSAGLFQLAFGLSGAGKSEILVSPFEYPSNYYAWVRAAERGGPRVTWLPCKEARVTPELVADAITENTVALAVSAVDFRSGYRADLAGLREVLGDRLLLVDAIQGFGVVDMDWSQSDATVVGGQKWLRSSWGTGFVSLSGRALDRLGDSLTGPTGAADWTNFDETVHPSLATAGRFSMTNADLVAVARLAAGLDLVAGLTPQGIDHAVQRVVGLLFNVIEHHGGSPLIPLSREERSGIVSFSLPPHSAEDVGRALGSRGVIATVRADHVRLSPHATTPEDIVGRVDDALGSLNLVAH